MISVFRFIPILGFGKPPSKWAYSVASRLSGEPRETGGRLFEGVPGMCGTALALRGIGLELVPHFSQPV